MFRFLVFHGGSGSSKEEINTAVGHGVVKMNVDTDTQFAYMMGMRASLSVNIWWILFNLFFPHPTQDFFESKKEYLRAQVGNPEGLDKPNKKVIIARILQRVRLISPVITVL